MNDGKAAAVPVDRLRIRLGLILFWISIALPLLGLPLVASVGFSTAIATGISGALLVAGDLLGIGAVAVMGKPGYTYFKRKLLRVLKRHGPPARVGRTRYTVGLVMFSAAIIFGWVAPYAGGVIPGYRGNEHIFGIAGDIVFVASLFVLGGDFWDKLRGLFDHRANSRASSPDGPAA